jgi:acetylornithine deacetylase
MITEDHKQRILDAVDAAFETQLSFTQELVRHPSLRTREGSAQDLLHEAMASRGLEMDRWELDAGELGTHPVAQ